jgi:hypothetical protein
MLTIFFTGVILKNHIKIYQNQISQYKIQIINEPLFSLFCIKEYTNKQGSNWLSFLNQHTNYKSTQWSSFLATFLSSCLSTFIDVLASLNDVLWRHLTASNTQFIMTFRATYRRPFNVVYCNGLATLAVVRYTFFTFLQHLLFDTGGRLLGDTTVVFTQ